MKKSYLSFLWTKTTIVVLSFIVYALLRLKCANLDKSSEELKPLTDFLSSRRPLLTFYKYIPTPRASRADISSCFRPIDLKFVEKLDGG